MRFCVRDWFWVALFAAVVLSVVLGGSAWFALTVAVN